MISADWVSELTGVTLDRHFAIIVLATLFAGFLRGFIGFGAALVTIPVISLVFGPHAAVPIVTVMGLPSTVQLLPDAIRYSERAIVVPMAIAIFAATPIGTWILIAVDQGLMKIVISAIVVSMVGFLAMGWSLKEKVSARILLFAGTVGGLVQGAAGIGGPPVVAVALSRAGAPERQRGNVLAVMTAISLSSLPPLYYYGLFTRQAIVIGLVLLPLYSFGTWFGSRFFSGGGAKYYRGAALIILAIIGLVTLMIALRDYLDIS
ncbi:MAG: sulfite exporter TauE/SafE family protein [Hyphomicrobiaceae bacterium]